MKMKFMIATSVLALLAVFFVFNRSNTDVIDLINQEMATLPSSSGGTKFNLLDATQFTDSMYPWLGYPVTIISEQELLGEGDHVSIPPDKYQVKRALAKFKGKKRVILDFPSYQVKSDKKEDVLAKLHIKWFLQIIECVRDVLPGVDVGIFDMPYSPWKALKSTNRELVEYQKVIAFIKPVIDATDTLYPVFKVFTSDESDLSYLMGVQLYTAKTLSKPVFPIVSHKDITKQQNGIANELVPVQLVKQQCDFVRKNADGMVWLSLTKEPWDSSWYNAVYENCFL